MTMNFYLSALKKWKGIISLLNFLLLIMLYIKFPTKINTSNYSLKDISYKDNKLLEEEYFSRRVANKRVYSMSDSITNFLNCITEEPLNGTRQTRAQFNLQLYACIKLHIPIETYELDSFKAINTEYKYFLPIDKTYYADASNNCFYFTVGIGNHTIAEKQFLKLYPRCKLIGVEISPYNVGDFATFGKVINVGIGFKNQIEIITNYKYADQINQNVTVKPLNMILVEAIGGTLVHYATIDIEGQELDMLKGFEEFGDYHKNGIVFCQMDIEFHNHVPSDKTEFPKYMRHLLHKAPAYLPIYAGPYGGADAIKMTMINIKSADCEVAFHFSKYFQR